MGFWQKTIFVLFFFLILAAPAQAAFFELKPSNVPLQVGQTADIQLMVHTEGEQAAVADAYIDFNVNGFLIETITKGTIYPYVTTSYSSGRIGVSATRTSAAGGFSGSGTLATFRMKAVKAGTYDFTFRCGSGITTYVSKITRSDVVATNIIDCTKNIKLTSTVTTTVSTSIAPDPTPACDYKMDGDADCNNIVDMPDFEIWRKEYLRILTTILSDFDTNTIVDLLDFETWRKRVY